jgi:NAD(P)-dependent dehydrogenase (short-subunit alcohol dehydrogenase family)
MARVLVTGSADGLGQAAAGDLIAEGHQVVVHARSAERLASVETIIGRGAVAVVGDLSDLDTSCAARTSCRSTSSHRTCSPPSSSGRSGS